MTQLAHARQVLAGARAAPQAQGAVNRLTPEEPDALLDTAYERSGARELMVRNLAEGVGRVGAFCRMRAEDVSLAELEVRVVNKGDKALDVSILRSLVRELWLHLGDRRTGYLPPAPTRWSTL